ncbi:MAG: hypothetical protein K9W43_11120 [Candidatus Thorarchaeota archaeon]|nr:hypothetical protein [Candidatus Thorarchaeota archaeon]
MREERLNDPSSCGHRSQEGYSYNEMDLRGSMSTSAAATIFWMDREHTPTFYGSGWQIGVGEIMFCVQGG